MLKRKLLPDRLGSLVGAKFEDKQYPDPKERPVSALDSGEELQELHEAEVVVEEEEENFDSVADEGPIIRQGSGQIPVSASDVIAAEEKRSDLQYELSQQEINLEKLQRIASKGLPDGGGLRATAWKLLLGYLPPSRDEWEKELSENRLKYAKLKDELLSSPSEFSSRKVEDLPIDSKGPLRRHKISPEDHPLSVGKMSSWNQFFKYTEIVEQIDRDLQRTHPDMRFFSGETPNSRKHRQAMKNILLLFAKLNPVIGYVQGMNEVLAPLYFVFTTDTNEKNVTNAEADSFSCFVRLLSDSIDHFCQELDNSSVGILSTISRLSDLLKANDEELWRHLEVTTKVEPQFYGFRWITLLLTQEFDFQTILRIWDSLLGNPFGVQDMLLRVCCAMLLCVKSKLINGDFIVNLKLLQHYPVHEVGVEHLLQVATDLSPDTSSYRLSL